MLVKRSRTRAGDGMAMVLNLESSKCVLLQVDGEAIEAAEVKDVAEVQLMRLKGVRKHQNIIKIDETEREITKYLVHHPLKSLGGVLEAKGEAKELKEAKGSDAGCLVNVGRSHGNLEVAFLEIMFGEELGSGGSGREIRDRG